MESGESRRLDGREYSRQSAVDASRRVRLANRLLLSKYRL